MKHSSYMSGKRLAQSHSVDELLTAVFLRSAKDSEIEKGLKSAFPAFYQELKHRKISTRGLLNKDFLPGTQILFIPEWDWDLLGKPNHFSTHRRYGFVIDQEPDHSLKELITCAFWDSDDSGALMLPVQLLGAEIRAVNVNLLLTENSVSQDAVSNTLHHIRSMRRKTK